MATISRPLSEKPSDSARAIHYVLQEFSAHAELHAARSDEAASIFNNLVELLTAISTGATGADLTLQVDQLFELVGEFEQACLDLVAGAEAQAAEFGKELEELKSKPVERSINSGENQIPSLEVIAEELLRRQTHARRLSEL